MTRMSFRNALFLGSFLIVAPWCLIGCGNADSPTQTSSTESGQAASSTSQATDGPADFTGVWLGIGSLDAELVAEKLATISDESERARVEAIAASFQSTRIGISFAEDQTYQFDMVITGVDGQMRRGETAGTWKIQNQTAQTVVIEQRDDASEEVTTTEYQIVDADHFAMTAPVAEIFQDCKPMIVFERQGSIEEVEAAAQAASAATDEEVQR